jgi:hypothetical protein
LHQVYYEQGRALVLLDRTDEARAAFEKSLELYPGYERAENALKSLDG